MRSIAIGLLLATATTISARATPPPEAGERQQLMESLKTSCRQFMGEQQWVQLNNCHRAWFNAHEEQVWRLRLNPHAGAHLPGPSS